MTEREWLAWTDASVLLRRLMGAARLAPRLKPSERKLSLFAAACYHRIEDRIDDPRVRMAAEEGVERATARTNGGRLRHKSVDKLLRADPAWSDSLPGRLAKALASRNSWNAAMLACDYAAVLAAGPSGRAEEEHVRQAPLLRDILGNPFRPIAFDPEWRTAAAVALARSMYEGRDFAPMPVLADALQDAGCEDPAVLGHCRDPDPPHGRGCWVVDLVLGRT